MRSAPGSSLPTLCNSRCLSKSQSFLMVSYNTEAELSLKKLSDISARRKKLDKKTLPMPKIPPTVAIKVSRKVRHAARENEFSKKATKLEENLSESIYLCAGATRFFWVDIHNKATDLVVLLKCAADKAVIYASYSNTTPGPTSFEFISVKPKLILSYSEDRAKRERCSLAVYAKVELEASIECWFLAEVVQLTRKKKKDPKIPEVLMRLERLRVDKRLRAELNEDVSEILERRLINKASTQDFVQLNRTFTSHSKLKPRNIDLKLSRAKKRRLELSEDKQSYKTAIVNRMKVREIATVKAQRIHSICQRKSNFEQLWMTNLFSVLVLDELHTRFSKIKSEILQQKLEYCMVVKVQRNWKRYLGNKLDFETRLLLQARNTCLLWRDHMKAMVDYRNDHSLVMCMKESAYVVQIPNTFNSFIRCVIKVQTNWRESKTRELRRMELLVMQWNKALDAIINVSVSKYRRKRRRQLTEKYLSIPVELRDKLLWKHYVKVKETFNRKFNIEVNQIFTFLLSDKAMTDLIKKASKLHIKQMREL